eukprot:g2384.t1
MAQRFLTRAVHSGRLKSSSGFYSYRNFSGIPASLSTFVTGDLATVSGIANETLEANTKLDLGSSVPSLLATSADKVSDEVAEVVLSVSDLGNSPSDLLLKGMDVIHDYSGLPWFGVIIGTTVGIRTLLLPYMIKMLRGTSKMAALSPKLKEINDYSDRHGLSQEQKALKIKALWEKEGVNPFHSFGMMLLQMPIFMSYFFALKKAPDYCPDMCSEGALWFPDLSQPDTVLALSCALGFLATIEVGADGQNQTEQTKTMKNFMRFMAIAMVPAAMNFPASLSLYWTANNTFSLVQTAILQIPGVKPALGILPPPPPQETSSSSSSPLSGVFGSPNPDANTGFANSYGKSFGGGKESEERNAVREREEKNLRESVERDLELERQKNNTSAAVLERNIEIEDAAPSTGVFDKKPKSASRSGRKKRRNQRLRRKEKR